MIRNEGWSFGQNNEKVTSSTTCSASSSTVTHTSLFTVAAADTRLHMAPTSSSSCVYYNNSVIVHDDSDAALLHDLQLHHDNHNNNNIDVDININGTPHNSNLIVMEDDSFEWSSRSTSSSSSSLSWLSWCDTLACIKSNIVLAIVVALFFTVISLALIVVNIPGIAPAMAVTLTRSVVSFITGLSS
jgi:hypothetical protein